MTVQHLAGRVAPVRPDPSGLRTTPAASAGASFAELLGQASQSPRLTVSAHAAQRVDERGIDLSEPTLHRIEAALDALHAKGARDAVLLRPDAAFIVNVPSRTVVTALAPDEMRDRVVTQIDSAMAL